MNLTAWVDVAIGLSIVYIGASLFVTVINEFIAQSLNLRGKQLCGSIKALFDDQNVRTILARSPVLKPFFGAGGKKAPSYVDPNVLARLLVGSLADPGTGGKIGAQVSATIGKWPDSNLKRQLLALVQSTEEGADALVKTVSDWTDRSLTVLGEGYKRNLQIISLVIGLAVAIVLNLDTVTLTEHLYRDKEARDAAVAIGVRIAEQSGEQTLTDCLALSVQERRGKDACLQITGLMETVQGRNATLGKLPVGWPPPASPLQESASAFGALGEWASRIVGWLLTALALSLGAPFWFDLLNKLVNVRYGMRRPSADKEK